MLPLFYQIYLRKYASSKLGALGKMSPSPSKTRKQKRFGADIDNFPAANKFQDSSCDDSYLDTNDDESINNNNNRKTAEEECKDPVDAEKVTLLEEKHWNFS